MMPDFNPSSPDAMFSRILARLEEQDRSATRERNEVKGLLEDIRSQGAQHGARIGKLERWRDTSKVKVAAVITTASVLVTTAAWVIEHWAMK